MFEPERTHHYQPGYTMVAGGVLGSAAETAKKQSKYITKPMASMFQAGINLQHEAVASFSPDLNKFVLKNGEEVHYEYLVLGAGLRLNYEAIAGAVEALDDPSAPVGSMYRLDYAYKFA